MDTHSDFVELATAIRRREFTLLYQPIVDVRSNRIKGMEALSRWEHPHRGLLGPEEFLGRVEAAGLQNVLTAHVLDEATAQCARWRRAGIVTTVSVNVWPSDVHDPLVLRALSDLLHECEIEPAQLTLEVSERRGGDDGQAVADGLLDLSRRGVRLSLDDFGAGESSLLRLRRLRFDEVKLDRGLVSGHRDRVSAVIVEFAVRLARELGMQATVEGIGDEETLQWVRSIGVHRGQGFHFGPPVTAREATQMLLGRRGGGRRTTPFPVLFPEQNPSRRARANNAGAPAPAR